MKIYGKVTWSSAGKWKLSAEPHVLMRIKRIFAKVDASSKGAIHLSNSPENAREIEWLLTRYPMEISEKLQARLTEMADRHRQRDADIERVLSGEYKPPTSLELAIPLREYQSQAAALADVSGGLLVCDSLGLGKTATAIGTFTPERLPVLVVTMTHLTKQWEREVHRFAPSLSVHIATKGKSYPLDAKGKQGDLFGEKPGFPDVIVMNYAKLRGWADELAPVVNSVVYDEVQELRNRKSNQGGAPPLKYSAARHISDNVKCRIGLSGTPIYNYGGEMWNVMECIAPGELGDWSEFYREWCSGYADKAKISKPKVFGRFMRERGLMLRRSREDVGRELPALTKVPHYIDADPKVIEAAEDSAMELARIIMQEGGSKELRQAKWKAAEELSILLRKYTGIAKAPYVAEFVNLLVESGEQVVLYGWHRDVYSIWQHKLRNHQPVMFTGSETPRQKEISRETFMRGDARVLIVSLRSGAGLDGLQKVCRIAVVGELDWSPAVHEQCIGRVYRDGQPDPVTAYFLLADTGSDPIVADVLGIKKSQSDGIREPDGKIYEGRTDANMVRELAQSVLAKRGELPSRRVG